MTTATPQRWRREFPPESAAVRTARRFVLETPAAAAIDGATLGLLVSEVVSNAVLHARTAFVVTVTEIEDGVLVEIEDGDARLPRVEHPQPSRITGRGLAIVSSLARRWGARRSALGKTVWFEVGFA